MLADMIDGLDTGALFSPCRRWRYLLWRRWDPSKGVVMFVGLNPSTADETKDDPTIRRCIGYAKDWGYGALWMLNIFAFRATAPADMKRAGEDAIGPRNNEYLVQAGHQANLVVAAWGAHGGFLGRQARVLRMLQQAQVHVDALGVTAGGFPKHPLYLRKDLVPAPFVVTPKLEVCSER